MERFVALLRGINVGGNNQVSMPELRSLCADLGWEGVQSYINSGNLLFRAEGTAAFLEAELERVLERRLGLSIPVIIRTAADWTAYVTGNPYPAVSQSQPNLLALVLSKARPNAGAVEGLRERAQAGERVDQVGDALWIYYQDGVARSKLAPALLDRLVGSPTTARNWRTVLKLQELAQLSLEHL